MLRSVPGAPPFAWGRVPPLPQSASRADDATEEAEQPACAKSRPCLMDVVAVALELEVGPTQTLANALVK